MIDIFAVLVITQNVLSQQSKFWQIADEIKFLVLNENHPETFHTQNITCPAYLGSWIFVLLK